MPTRSVQPASAMPVTRPASQPALLDTSYAALLSAVRKTIESGKQRAFAAVERVLKCTKSITITTSKSDKYDRYLTDVFYQTGKGEHYLNQELLDKGYAVRM